ncbi:ATP-dependent acyl-CoA ligase [soil metagenome]
MGSDVQGPPGAGDPALLTALVGKGTATIGEVLAARVALTPDAPFIEHQQRRWTYAQGWTESRRFAGFLTACDLAGTRVAAFLPKCPEALFAWFGAVLSRGIYVALNRAHRGPVLADLVARCGAGLLVTDREGWEIIGDLLPVGLTQVLFIDSLPATLPSGLRCHAWRDVAGCGPAEPAAGRPGDIATLLYTSGTTGRSKAVLVPHNMYCRGAAHLADCFGYHSDDRFHDWMPMSHIGGQLHVTMTAIVAGACLIQVPAFSRHRFWEEVRASDATVFSGFASILSLLLEAPASPDDRRHKLRRGLIGNMPAELLTAFERRFGVTLLDTYGMSECEPLTLPRVGEMPAGSCGRVCPDFEVAILDEDDYSLPLGEPGRICVRPRVPHVMMQAYEGDAEATISAWRNLWFHTSDRGRFDADGYLYFIDRMKYAIRRGGENISPSEVEQVFLEHPDVVACAAVGVPDRVMGEEVKIVAVLSAGTQCDAPALHIYAKTRMAGFMVPRYIEIATSLPYTVVGKLRREELRDINCTSWDARTGSRRMTT